MYSHRGLYLYLQLLMIEMLIYRATKEVLIQVVLICLCFEYNFRI
jgi:hypothetical protein